MNYSKIRFTEAYYISYVPKWYEINLEPNKAGKFEVETAGGLDNFYEKFEVLDLAKFLLDLQEDGLQWQLDFRI
jgi:hypothetical protein